MSCSFFEYAGRRGWTVRGTAMAAGEAAVSITTPYRALRLCRGRRAFSAEVEASIDPTEKQGHVVYAAEPIAPGG